MEILYELFGGESRVKIMRFFLAHPQMTLSEKDIAVRAKVSSVVAERELQALKKINFIKQKSLSIDKKKIQGWHLNSDFPILHPLRNLLATQKVFTKQTLARRFKNAGKIKLIITSGVFIHEEGSRVDLFVVGDMLKPARIDSVVRSIEADLGQEIRYATCDTGDFIYRLNAYDRFIRDILDYPHNVIIDKIGIEGL